MRVTILSVSINPSYYDMSDVCGLSYDEAKEYFAKDEIGCCRVTEFVVDQTKENETSFHADGLPSDPTDTVLNWVKVENENK